MKYLTSKLGLLVILMLSSTIASAGSMCASSDVYRTYYLTSGCTYYYTDGMGNRVTDGQYADMSFTGLPLMQDANGRWYYQDSFGNRIYKVKRCS